MIQQHLFIENIQEKVIYFAFFVVVVVVVVGFVTRYYSYQYTVRINIIAIYICRENCDELNIWLWRWTSYSVVVHMKRTNFNMCKISCTSSGGT